MLKFSDNFFPEIINHQTFGKRQKFETRPLNFKVM